MIQSSRTNIPCERMRAVSLSSSLQLATQSNCCVDEEKRGKVLNWSEKERWDMKDRERKKRMKKGCGNKLPHLFSLYSKHKKWKSERKQKGNRSPGMFAKAHYKWSREDNVWLFFFFAVSSSCSRRRERVARMGMPFPWQLFTSSSFSFLHLLSSPAATFTYALVLVCFYYLFCGLLGDESERGWFFFFVPKKGKTILKTTQNEGSFFAACLIDYLNVVEKGRFSIYSNIR